MIKFIKNIYYTLTYKGFFNWIPSKLLLKMQFRFKFGKKLDLQNPRTFNEKIQWLKLYGNLEKYADLVDKYEVRKYVAETIGEEYLIPILGIYDKFEDIDFNKLPEQFVLKCTHDSGSVLICKDKNTFNTGEAKNKLNKYLKQNFYYAYREPQYKNIKPRIIAEKYMIDESGEELKDYKFFCFNGVPKMLFVASDRNIHETKFDFFDLQFNKMQVKQHYPNSENPIDKPKNFHDMLSLSEKICKNFIHCRADFYEINNKIYFGELTFTHFGGQIPFEPKEFDLEMGNWLKLPELNERIVE